MRPALNGEVFGLNEEKQRGIVNLVVGLCLVSLGALLLIAQIAGVNIWSHIWPFLVIIPGLLFFVGMVFGGREMGALAIPGCIITTVGLILLYQSIFNRWHTWAYLWSLAAPTSVGVGLWLNGMWSGSPSLREEGRRLIRIGLVIFLLAAVFFEFVLDFSGLRSRGIGPILWPALIIAFGIYLMLSPSGLFGRKPDGPSEP